jgi:hypothetical protein
LIGFSSTHGYRDNTLISNMTTYYYRIGIIDLPPVLESSLSGTLIVDISSNAIFNDLAAQYQSECFIWNIDSMMEMEDIVFYSLWGSHTIWNG